MAREPKVAKSETLTIRLDPKTRFVLEYISRLKGQTITTVVERAIMSAAGQEKLKDYEYGGELSWNDFWDVSEGVRALQMSSRREFYPTYEEEKRLAFCKEHWPFFFADGYKKIPLNHYVDVLWPKIDHYVQMHDDMKPTDYFAAGKAMQKALRDANLKAPEWPTDDGEAKKAPEGGNFSRDLDDEIPF